MTLTHFRIKKAACYRIIRSRGLDKVLGNYKYFNFVYYSSCKFLLHSFLFRLLKMKNSLNDCILLLNIQKNFMNFLANSQKYVMNFLACFVLLLYTLQPFMKLVYIVYEKIKPFFFLFGYRSVNKVPQEVSLVLYMILLRCRFEVVKL